MNKNNILIHLSLFLSIFSVTLKAEQKVSLQLSWLHQFQFAGFYIAKEKGFYKDVNLDVEIREFTYGLSTTDAIKDKKVDFAIGRSSLIINKANGEDVVALGADFQRAPLMLLVTKKSNIENIQDLRNKRVMITYDAIGSAAITAMLNSNGLSLDDIQVQKHSFDINDLIDNKTDAMASYVSNEPIILDNEHIEYRIFHPKEYGFDFYGDILFTSSRYIKNNPKRVKNFFDASMKGWKYAFDNIEESVDIIYEKYNTQKKTKSTLLKEARELKKLAYDDIDKMIGCLDKNKLQKIVDVYKVLGLITEDINLNEFIYTDNPHKTYAFELSRLEIFYLLSFTLFIIVLSIILFVYSSLKSEWLVTNSQLLKELEDAKKEIAKNYRRLQKLTENVPGAVYQYRLYPDGNGEFTYASNGMKDIYDVSPEDVIKDRNSILQYTHKDDKDMFAAAVLKSIATMEEWNLEYRVILPKKGLCWLHGKSTPEKLSDGSILWSGVIDDITEPVKHKQELERKKQELETVIQNAPNPMMLHNEDGKILMMNNAWIKSSGFVFDKTATMDKLIEAVYKDAEDKSNLKKHIESLYDITEKIDEGEFSFYNKNGDLCTFKHFSSPLGLVNNKRTIIGSAIDITESKKKDKLIYEQSKMASMGEMIGNIAHQWRQPLSIISTGATGMQVQKEYGLLTDELFDKTCTDINNNAQYLSKTIDDFKNFIKNDRAKVTFNLSEDINSFIALVQGSIKNNNINLVLNFKDNIVMNGYPNELIQCLINIFNNAKDALKENNIQDEFIFISTSQENDQAIIKIKDNAGGIPEEILVKIFEPYFTTKHKSKGTGLGLSMTYNLIVDGMNGIVKADNVSYIYENKQYTGAEFTIILPMS